jgi:hypothetical protein
VRLLFFPSLRIRKSHDELLLRDTLANLLLRTAPYAQQVRKAVKNIFTA